MVRFENAEDIFGVGNGNEFDKLIVQINGLAAVFEGEITIPTIGIATSMGRNHY